jgi:hypothetical protein
VTQQTNKQASKQASTQRKEQGKHKKKGRICRRSTQIWREEGEKGRKERDEGIWDFLGTSFKSPTYIYLVVLGFLFFFSNFLNI